MPPPIPGVPLGAKSGSALSSFATEIVCCLHSAQAGDATLDLEKILACAEKWRDAEVLVYGFTFVLGMGYIMVLVADMQWPRTVLFPSLACWGVVVGFVAWLRYRRHRGHDRQMRFPGGIHR